MAHSVFVSIVAYESAPDLPRCLRSLLEQGYTLGENLHIRVTDNGSKDGGADVAAKVHSGISVDRLPVNLGFAAGQNKAIREFLAGPAEYLLILNPDVRLLVDCLGSLVRELEAESRLGLATPKLLRGDDSLDPLLPAVIDAAGMVLESSIRHFDRGSDTRDIGQFEQPEEVFGGTGACLLLRRSCVEQLLLRGDAHDADSALIYPELAAGRLERAPLFDEAFFAYREDADLAWRARTLGWGCCYIPEARAIHRRTVTPERRSELPVLFNRWSVRNRFLLQLNNLSFPRDWRMILPGVIVRNLVVLLGVLTVERTSLPAIREAITLRHRALERRRILLERAERVRGIDGTLAVAEEMPLTSPRRKAGEQSR